MQFGWLGAEEIVQPSGEAMARWICQTPCNLSFCLAKSDVWEIQLELHSPTMSWNINSPGLIQNPMPGNNFTPVIAHGNTVQPILYIGEKMLYQTKLNLQGLAWFYHTPTIDNSSFIGSVGMISPALPSRTLL